MFIMITDNHRKGRAFRAVLPFLGVTLLLGAIGPCSISLFIRRFSLVPSLQLMPI
jgi:hypothetical protein